MNDGPGLPIGPLCAFLSPLVHFWHRLRPNDALVYFADTYLHAAYVNDDEEGRIQASGLDALDAVAVRLPRPAVLISWRRAIGALFRLTFMRF